MATLRIVLSITMISRLMHSVPSVNQRRAWTCGSSSSSASSYVNVGLSVLIPAGFSCFDTEPFRIVTRRARGVDVAAVTPGSWPQLAEDVEPELGGEAERLDV